jgi:hypothetical protein
VPHYYANGLPADLDAELTAVRFRAEQQFEDARQGKSESEVRRLLITLRIKPEVVAFVRVACEMALRGWLEVGAIQPAVDEHRAVLARQLCPDTHTDSAWDQRFQKEVRETVTASPEWKICRTAIIDTADKVARHKRNNKPHAAELSAPPTEFSQTRSQRTTVEGPSSFAKPFDLSAADLTTKEGRQAALRAFLTACNEEAGERLGLSHIWHAMRHSGPRQLQYWTVGQPRSKVTKATDQNVRRILGMTPTDFRRLLHKLGPLPR